MDLTRRQREQRKKEIRSKVALLIIITLYHKIFQISLDLKPIKVLPDEGNGWWNNC